jgi:hypothetical protein
MMSTPRIRQVMVAAAVTLGAAWLTVAPGQAHKAITSKFHYNEDLFPLFREHCGRCHVEGGVAPMSLMTYDDAAPWAESLRLELLAEDAVPWHPWKLTARELDIMLVWASGGAPRGDAAKAPPPVPLINNWAAGPPDVTVKPPTFVLAADKNEASVEHTLPLPPAAGRDIAFVDVLPGNPAIVRHATIRVKAANGAVLDTVSWRPGQAAAVALKAPVRVGAGSSVVVTIDYKRTWKYEGQEMRDESAIGLYAVRPATSTARPGARPR